MRRSRPDGDIATRDKGFERDVVAAMPRLRSFAISLCGRTADADDMVQDTVVKALRKHDSFEPGTNLQAWLMTILRNDFLSARRKAGRIVADPDGAFTASLASLPDQDDVVELKEVRRRIAMMPLDMRVALLTIGEMGGAYEEAAEFLGVATGTMKSRVSRARQMLLRLGRVVVIDVEEEPDSLGDVDIVKLKRDFVEGSTISELVARYGVPAADVMRHVMGLRRKGRVAA